MKAQYIGEDCVYADPISAQSTVLENGKEYDIDTRYDSPQIIINNQVVEHPDATIWVMVNGVEIPYAPSLLDNFWRAVE